MVMLRAIRAGRIQCHFHDMTDFDRGGEEGNEICEMVKEEM